MIVPIKTMNGFKVLKSQGDIKQLHLFSIEIGEKISEMTFSKALRSGRMNEKTLEVLTKYYAKKREKFNQLIQTVTEDDGN